MKRFFFALSIFLNFSCGAKDNTSKITTDIDNTTLGMGLPYSVGRVVDPFMYFIASETKLLESTKYVEDFISIGKNDLKRFKKHLKKSQVLMIRQTLNRAQMIIDTKDKKLKKDLIIQITEIMYYYRNKFKNLHEKYPENEIYAHPFFRRATHSFFKHLPYYKDAIQEKSRSNSINLITDNKEFLKDNELKNIKDTSIYSPKDSFYWKNKYIEDIEPYFYFQNEDYNRFCLNDPLFTYRKAKRSPEKGGGYNYGFKVFLKQGDNNYKVKIKPAMVRRPDDNAAFFFKQEPFYEPSGNAIYSMLGYNTDTGFFCNNTRIVFNDKLINVKVSNKISNKLWDIGSYYKYAVLENGDWINFRDVVQRIVYKERFSILPARPMVEEKVKYKIKPNYKGRIKEIILHGAYIEYRKENTKRFSGWSKMLMGHHSRREVRALSIIDTWLGAPENFGNNSFKLSLNRDTGEMKFVLTDVGNIFSSNYRNVDLVYGNYPKEIQKTLDDMEWEKAEKLLLPYRYTSELELEANAFTFSVFKNQSFNKFPEWHKLEENQKMDRVSKDLQFQSYKYLNKFNKLVNFDDLKFGVRLISRLSEKQILHALCLSGLGYSGALLTTEKLISRRDELVRYFALQNEISLLRPEGANYNLSYKKKKGKIKVKNYNGKNKKIKIPSNGHSVRNGEFYTDF